MSIRFQYNKTELQRLDKQLKIRLKALPTLKNKEAALRLEVKKAKDSILLAERELRQAMDSKQDSLELWAEFDPDLLKISAIRSTYRKIAGIPIPIVEELVYSEPVFSVYNHPVWFADGISFLKSIAAIVTAIKFQMRKMQLLEQARRKATQKVNLYEKVQIPQFEQAIRKIKRFLEDEENLARSAQKIVKKRQQKQREIPV